MRIKFSNQIKEDLEGDSITYTQISTYVKTYYEKKDIII